MTKNKIIASKQANGENWKTFKLGEIASSIKGKRPTKLYDTDGEDLIPYINIKAFEIGEFDHFTTGEDCRLCDKGDLLIVWDGSRSGLVGRAYEGAICSTIARIDIEGIINDYGYYFILSNYQYLNTNTKGSGTPHVDPNLLWNLDIPVPPKETQRYIVEKIEELFSDLDNGIKNLQKAQKQLESYKQAVLKAAFEGKLTKEWREQQDGLPTPEELKQQIEQERKKYREQQLEEWEQEVEEWKEDGDPGPKPRKPRKLSDLKDIEEDELENLDKVPPSWLLLRTQEIGEWNGGGTPRRSNNEYWKNGIIPWVSPKDMKRKDIATTQDLMTEKALSESSSARIVDKDAILFVTRSGILRRTLPVAIAKNDLTINQDLKALTPVIDISSEYIYWYCKANDSKIRRECSKDGTTVESIKTQSLKNYPIPVCSPHEQKQIVEEIESKTSSIQELTRTIDQELQKAESLRQSVLKQAFEGKLIKEESLTETESVPADNELSPFNQMQMIGILIDTLEKEFNMAYGEMALAKYLYLIDRIKKYRTGLKFKDWHWGPYDPDMKGLIYKKDGFFQTGQKSTIQIKESKRETLLKYNLHDRELFEEGIREISQIISRFEGKKSTSRQLELLATACKVIENEQSTDLKSIRNGMDKWDTEKGDFKNKAAKFSKKETKRCLNFILKKGWERTLIT